MPLFNPSYHTFFEKRASDLVFAPEHFMWEKKLVQNLEVLFEKKESLVFLHRFGFETEDKESFNSFCETNAENKKIIDFTMAWLDPQVYASYGNFDKDCEIFNSIKRFQNISDEEIDRFMESFLLGFEPFSIANLEKMRLDSEAECMMFVQYPEHIKEICLEKGIQTEIPMVRMLQGMPSNKKSLKDLKKRDLRKNKAILTGSSLPKVYPVRHLIRLENPKSVHIRAKGDMSDFKQEHISFLEDLEDSVFSICTPSIMQLPVAKYYESIWMGAIVVTPRFENMELYGLVENETCLVLDLSKSVEDQILSFIGREDLEYIQRKAYFMVESLFDQNHIFNSF